MATFNPSGRKALAPYPSVFSRAGALKENEDILKRYQTPGTTASTTYGGDHPQATPPEIGSTPFTPPPVLPPAAASYVPPPVQSNPAAADNIIDFNAPTDYAAEAAQQDDSIASLDARESEAQANHDAALKTAREFREQPNAVNPPTPDGAAAAPVATAPVSPPPRRPFAGFTTTGPTGPTSIQSSAWSEGRPDVHQPDPNNPNEDADANFASALKADPWSRGIPDKPNTDSGQTTRFYERVQKQWEKQGRSGTAPLAFRHYR